MPRAKVRIGGQWVNLGVTSSEVDNRLANLENKLNNADEYINGAFKDGVVSVIEAKKIQSFLNQLDVAKKEHDTRYNELYNNPQLSAEDKTTLSTQKSQTDAAYNDLVSTINNTIADNKASEEDSALVDAKFQAYRDELALLVSLMTRATDKIAGKHADQARKEAQEYTDAAKADLQEQIDATDTYIDGAFKDGIIYDSEYRKIQGYINTLQAKKAEFDQKYNEIYNKPELTGSAKTNLETAKATYDTAYNDLINTINNAIEDQKATPEETADVDAKFATYRNALSVLSAAFEEAVYQTTSGRLAPIDDRLKQAESAIIQHDNEIELRVKETDYNGNEIASRINQTATTVQIEAEKINLNGKVSFSHFSPETQQAVSSRNLIKNSIFLDQRFWTVWHSFWTLDTVTKYEGTNTVRYAQTGLTTGDLERKITSNDAPVVEGKPYTASVYVNSDDITSFDSDAICEIQWLDEANAVLSSTQVSMIPSQNNVWERKTVTGNAPVGTVKARLNLYVNQNGKLWVAKPMFQEGSVATPHTDELLTSPWTASGTTEIDGAHIKTGTISFDQAYGGTIKLGGASYGNAKLEMYDESGELRIALNASDRALDKLSVGRINSSYIVRRDPDMAENYYVDPVGGDDENDGLTEATAFKTVQHAIDQLPRFLDKNVFINIKAGSGLFTENLYITGFMGNGILFINGTGFSNILEGYVWVSSCSTQVVLQNLKIAYPYMNPPSASHEGVVTNFYSQMLYLYNCQIYGRGKATKAVKTYAGGHTHLSTVDVFDCTYGVSCERASFTLTTNIGGQYLTNWVRCDGSWVIASGDRPDAGTATANNGQVVLKDTTVSNGVTSGGYNPPYIPEKTQYSKTYTTSSADSWRTSYNAWRNEAVAMQGDWGYGVHRGYWFFGSQLSTDLTGATIKSMKLTVRRKTGHGYSTANVFFRWSKLATDPGTNNTQPFVSNEYTQASFELGQTRTINIPSNFFPYFESGEAKGFCIYTGTNTRTNYAIFYPQATLEVIYEK